MVQKRGKGTELKIFSGREAKLNRVIFLILNYEKLMTSYDVYLEIRRIKGFRHSKRQSIDRRIKTLYQQGWLRKEGIRVAKAHFLSPLYTLSTRAQIALLLDKTDLNFWLKTAPEPNLQMLINAVNICL